MLRKTNNLSEQIILFIGQSEIITLGTNQQIVLASRTLLLKQNVLLTYKNPVSGVDDPKLSAFSRSKNPPIPLDKLSNHQFQYKITASMLPKLLLGRKDEGVERYFKELRINKPKQSNLVVIVNQEDQCMNGFVFNRQDLALEFYQSLNIAVITQAYIQKLPQTIPFNYKIVSMLGQAANGRCLINPDDFAQGKNQQSQVGFVIDFLKGLEAWPLINMKGYLMQFQLQFKILDDSSKGYASRFLQCFPNKIERLKIQNAQLTSNIVYQLFPAYGLTNFCQRLNHLQELNLQKNQLTDDVFTTLAKIIYYCTKMHTLGLADNNITLQKQGSFEGFLTSITLLRLNLSLNKNRISSVKVIIKYLISADGTLPLSELDLSNNPISPQDTNILTKAYLNKIKQAQNNDFKLYLNQLEFSEPHSFQFLQEQYKNKKPNSMSIPVALTKHALRKKGKQIGNTQQQINRSSKIDELFKTYAYELFRGNFNKLKGIKSELRGFGVEQQIIEEQLKRYEPLKKEQQIMITNKIESCLNFELTPQCQLKQMNEAIMFCKRKGLSGPGFDLLCYLKDKIDSNIQLTLSEGKLGNLYRQIYYKSKGRYEHYYLQGILQQKSRLPCGKILQMSQRQLMKAFLECQNNQGFMNFVLFQYLIMEKSSAYSPQTIEYSLMNPQLSSLKIARFQKQNIVQIPQKQRIKKQFWTLKRPKIAFISQFSIQTYHFSQAFIESGVSSSAYSGVLSKGKVEPDQYKLIEAFIEISKNFLKFLYYTPEQLSDQAIMYLNYIVNHLGQLQNQIQNEFKLILAEEFFIHFFTFYDSSIHKKLKQGLEISICEFILRRVELDDELTNRVAAFLLKSIPDEANLRLHNEQAGNTRWSRKVDWRVKDLPTLRHLILSRGKVQVKIADYAHPDLVINIEVDQIDTVSDLWRQIKDNVGKLNQFTNISKTNIDYYWICGKKGNFQSQCFIFLPNYEHIGKLIFQDDYQITFYLKRLIFTPQQHSIKHLSMIKYQDLIAIFQQSKQNIRLVSTLILDSKALQQSIILSIWIDVLLTEQLLLGQLRRQNDEQSLRKYKLERQKIVNEMISKLYNVYIPTGFALDEKARTNIILQIKKKEQSAIPKNINQTIREQILNFVEKIGITAFTVAIFNENGSSTLFANNHEVIFTEQSQNQKTVLKVKFTNILWFQLVSEGKQISLRFQQIEKVQNEGATLHKFTISGDKQWIGSCLCLITQIARNRLSYPLSFLCANEDSPNFITNHQPEISKQNSLLAFPVLNIEKFFNFNLPRRVIQPTVLIAQPSQQKSVTDKVSPIQNQENPNNLAVEPQQIKKIQNPRESINTAQNKNLQIEDVIQAAENQQDEEVVSVRKSSNNNRKQPPRRRSRNR